MRLTDWLEKQTGISNAEFAARIGVTRQALWRYRSGERMPEAATIEKIAEFTAGAVTVSDIHAARMEWLNRSNSVTHAAAAPSPELA